MASTSALGKSRRDVLAAVPVKRFDIDQNPAFCRSAITGHGQLIEHARLAGSDNSRAPQDLQPGSVGVVHKEHRQREVLP